MASVEYTDKYMDKYVRAYPKHLCTSTNSYLVNFKSSEAEHANLISDVLPVMLRAFWLQVVDKLRSHWDDAIGHSLHVLQPSPRNMQLSRNREP